MTLKNYHGLLAFTIIRWAETLTLFDTLLDSEITTIIQNYTKWKQLILISSSFTYLDPDPLALTGHGHSIPCPSSCPFWQYSTNSGSASYFVVKLQILVSVYVVFYWFSTKLNRSTDASCASAERTLLFIHPTQMAATSRTSMWLW